MSAAPAASLARWLGRGAVMALVFLVAGPPIGTLLFLAAMLAAGGTFPGAEASAWFSVFYVGWFAGGPPAALTGAIVGLAGRDAGGWRVRMPLAALIGAAASGSWAALLHPDQGLALLVALIGAIAAAAVLLLARRLLPAIARPPGGDEQAVWALVELGWPRAAAQTAVTAARHRAGPEAGLGEIVGAVLREPR